MLTRLEPDPSANIVKFPLYYAKLFSKQREELINIAINKTDEEINERVVALNLLRGRLEKLPDNSPEKSLTDNEVQSLYNLITDEAEFPIIVYSEEFTVEEITHEQGREDSTYKLKIKTDIEQNDALLRAEAAMLIVDFGTSTNKFRQIRSDFIEALKYILDNMLCEKDQIFLNEKELEPSSYFIHFVEALYFTDKESARQFMLQFNVKETSFSFERRTKAN